MFTTYILYSKIINSYYTGHSNDLERRMKEHNSGRNSTTRKGVPWIVVFTVEFQTRGEAVQLEYKIKKRGAKRYLEDNGVVTPSAS